MFANVEISDAEPYLLVVFLVNLLFLLIKMSVLETVELNSYVAYPLVVGKMMGSILSSKRFITKDVKVITTTDLKV